MPVSQQVSYEPEQHELGPGRDQPGTYCVPHDVRSVKFVNAGALGYADQAVGRHQLRTQACIAHDAHDRAVTAGEPAGPLLDEKAVAGHRPHPPTDQLTALEQTNP